MRVQTRHTPHFGVARVLLGPGDAVQAVASTLLANSFGVAVTPPPRGGVRVHGKVAPSVYTAPAEGGWIDFAPETAGDVYPLEFDGKVGWCVAPSAVLVRPPTVRTDAAWPPLQKLFGGDSGFLEHFHGTGLLVLSAAGPVDAFELAAGELVTVRPEYLLAYPDTVQSRLRAIDPSGHQSVRTGEGLELDFAGPGTVLVQARSRLLSGT